jgi:Xaa-Pro dipeptidase
MSVDSPSTLEDTAEKQRRTREFLSAHGLGALVLSRRDSFAWFTCGGSSTLVCSSELGGATLVITPDQKYVIAYTPDIDHYVDEVLESRGYQPVEVRAYTGSVESEVRKILGDRKAASDSPLAGTRHMPSEIRRLFYPLTHRDIELYREIGRQAGEIIQEAAIDIHPGQTEREIAAEMQKMYVERGFDIHILLVGADARIAKYRHPYLTSNVLRKCALLVTGVSKSGLHVLCSRMVHFGLPAQELRDRHLAASTIHAEMVANCAPGKSFADLHLHQRRLFKDLGYADEWNRHFQGAMTGYVFADSSFLSDPQGSAHVGQAFGWFITIAGVKTEETWVLADQGPLLVSRSPDWPSVDIPAGNGTVQLPDILVR